MNDTAALATSTEAALSELAQSSSALGQLATALLAIIRIIPSLLLWTITFATITLPTWLFTLFSMSLTFTLNFTTLMLILVLFGSTISWVVRYRFLNMYSRLPAEPQRQEPQVEVFPETQDGDHKRGLSNYLDEFLSAIKVFGYLERPVFHELTRTMQTRKLIAGETLLLEEEKGFCLVVDGLVQIFVKANRAEDGPEDEDRSPGGTHEGDASDDGRGDHTQGYQLLTEVKNGAPMSSLFSILSLFTEDIKMRHDEEEDGPVAPNLARVPIQGFSTINSPAFGGRTPDSRPGSPIPSHLNSADARRLRGLSTSHGNDGALPRVPPLSLDVNTGLGGEQPNPNRPPNIRSRSRRAESAHPDIVARATVDTTIAVIPATAFRRLTRLYPRASAHIVQVILTRLQRVTLATGHAYLGLTSEVLRTERLMNKYTTYDLPGFLRDLPLERLKEKFNKERERIRPEEGAKGIALHNPNAGRRRRASSSGLRKEAAAHARSSVRRSLHVPGQGTPLQRLTSPIDERSGVSAGDLLTNGTFPRLSGRHSRLSFSQPYNAPVVSRRDQTPLERGNFNPFASRGENAPMRHQESLDEDGIFREAVLDCMFKAIGLTQNRNPVSRNESAQQSPRLISFDSRKQKAVFSNAFGFIDSYETSIDGETESQASVPLSSLSIGDPQASLEELSNEVEIVFFPKGSVLVEQGERNPGLYYVIDGFLDIGVPVDDDEAEQNVLGTAPQSHLSSSELFGNTRVGLGQASPLSASKEALKKNVRRKTLFMTKPGGLAGYLGTVSSYRSFIDVTAKTDVYVGFLPRAAIERIVERFPVVLLTMAKRLTTLLPRLILHIDFALEWVQVNAGQVIYNQGDDSDAIYIVLNGRLRAIQESAEGNKFIGEYGQGDSVGELEVLTESPRPASLHAIRDTELAKFPRTLFNSLALEHPGITIKISKIIARRMRALMEDPLNEPKERRVAAATRNNVSSTVNLRTLCILPVTAGVPVVEFAAKLSAALSQLGTANGVVSLNQAAILNHLGRHAFNKMGKLKLAQYLADLEEKYGKVLYVADTNVKSPWTQTCITQADCILLVGIADGSSDIGEYERFLLTTKTTARKELVLLHAERFCPPGLTRSWLRNRVWINGSHHHIQMSFRTNPDPVHPPMKRFGSAIKQRVQVLQAEIQKYTSRRVRQTPLYSADTPYKGDFHRLARRLCGKSVGLVLGGGGARGIAQVGIIRALEEAGIPIDLVGGTSIGAFIGALYAWDADVVPMYGRAKKFAGRMGSMWRFALDLTYPTASYTTGHEFNRGIFKTFGNSQIEDFWLEYYCNTTNISKSQSEIHTRGYAWRYVRASMSLAGLLPPICDNGNMLLDGGYIDNLTVSHMKAVGADIIFAIDVGSLDDTTPQQFGDSLSGFWAFFNRWNPFSAYPNPPTLSEIQARLAYVSSVDALERAKTTPGCRYLRPPIDSYGTLEFGKFDELYQLGYQYGKQYLSQLREEGVLPITEETEKEKNLRRTMAPRRASI